jgi:hypothetical protein
MRGRLTYANVVATLALFLSMSGGALAARHYLINSTKQINPKVLKKLIKAGKTGAIGKEGPGGKEGLQGKEGKEGAAGSAVAYAHVTSVSEPTVILDSANSKNVLAASEVASEPGVYCLTTTVPIHNATGNVDFEHEGKAPETVLVNFALVKFAIEIKACPPGTDVLVATENAAGTDEKADFWISFN